MKRLHSVILGLALSCAAVAGAQAAGYYSLKSSSAAYLSSSGGVWSTVLTTAVDSGTWVIQASSPAVNFGAGDILRCGIWLDGTQVHQASSMLGGGGGMPVAVEMTNLALVTAWAGQVVTLKCAHDAAVSGQRIDPGAVLVITRAPKK